ncbi:MAG: 2OG-Fe(II) oxygenase [Gammaproteobacteria bacterium]|nr:2OG-Fe(II) oxygenase [Gammaproteobacteria bacterium]|tara:strand:- start:12389 stop:13291 length:903 start_codon:yes stop_codon:yes gene_type:complete
MSNLIPELSFKDIEKGDTYSINLLKEALSNHGFFSITDHGLSKELINNCYESSIDFFSLDFEIKNTYSSVGSKGARGYTPKGIETAVGEKIADQKEFWHHGPLVDDTYDRKIPKNISINEIKDFNKHFDNLYLELHLIGSRVLKVIALSLDLEKDYFDSWIEKGNSLLRSIHYPPVNSNSNPHRARAHEDINLITLLIGAEEGGLEVLNKDGSWIKVAPSSDAIVCNIGDMMQLVTDKKLKSTTHRVIQDRETESKPRYSIPFFLHPAPSIVLKSVFRESDEGVLADDFLNQRLKEIKLY